MVDLYAIAELERRAENRTRFYTAWRKLGEPRARRDEYKVIRGKLYHDTRAGARLHILSFCLDDPRQGSVVTLPIIPVP